MRLLNVLLMVLVLAAVAQAQVPVYPYYNSYSHPLYSQPMAYPYPQGYPYAYPFAYSAPYYPGSLYPGSVSPQPYLAPNQPVINEPEVTSQMMQLQSQVDKLEDELAIARNKAEQTRPAQAEQTEFSAPESQAPPVALIFNNGERVESNGYVIAGQTLMFFTPEGSRKVALSSLNVGATQIENRKRGLTFVTPK